MSRAATPGRRRAGTAPARKLVLDIAQEAGDWSAVPDLDAVIETAAAALAALPGLAGLPHTGGAACVILLDDAHVRVLNATWRKKDKPTNVLSFPAPPPPRDVAGDGEVFLGDVVLAAETLAREAAGDDVPLAHHLQHLVIHGLLHLLGYDHETQAEAEAMEMLEIAALAAIGVANPYDADP